MKLRHKCHWTPQLEDVRLLSPQFCLNSMKDDTGRFTVGSRGGHMSFGSGEIIVSPLHPVSGLPIMTGFTDAKSAAKKMAIMHNCIGADNVNLSNLQKMLLKWHCRLGHTGMQLVQWIGRSGILGKFGQEWGSTKVAPPKCEVCCMGKQQRTPLEGHKDTRINEGALVKDQLKPGDLLFTDQCVSSLTGKFHNGKGQLNTQHNMRGGTLFWA